MTLREKLLEEKEKLEKKLADVNRALKQLEMSPEFEDLDVDD